MTKQKGSVFLIVLVLIATVLAAWQYGEFQSRKRVASAQEAEQQAEAQRVKDNTERQNTERAELERRQAQAKKEQDTVQIALKAVDDLAARWADAAKIAGATARMSLSGPVSTLQALKRESLDLTVPPCLDSGMAALRKSMDLTLEGYLTFMTVKGDLGNLLAGDLLSQGEAQLKSFVESRSACPS